MLCPLRAALGAVMVAATFTLTPATAGERATLKVTARVVERCTVGVPFGVPPGLWRDRQHQPWRFVRHRCGGPPPLWIRAKRVLLERLHDHLWAAWRDDRRGVQRKRHPRRDDVVLITVTY